MEGCPLRPARSEMYGNCFVEAGSDFASSTIVGKDRKPITKKDVLCLKKHFDKLKGKDRDGHPNDRLQGETRIPSHHHPPPSFRQPNRFLQTTNSIHQRFHMRACAGQQTERTVFTKLSGSATNRCFGQFYEMQIC